MKKLLYILDSGIFIDKDIYVDAPNYIFLKLLHKNYSKIIIIGQNTKKEKKYIKLLENFEVKLVSKYDFYNLLKEYLRYKNEVDEIICFGINGLFIAYLSKILRKKYILYIGGDFRGYANIEKRFIKKYLFLILDLLVKFLVKRSPKVHYCDISIYKKYPTKNKFLICSSVFIEYQKNKLIEREYKIKKLNPKDEIKLGIIGYVCNNVKGIDLIIKAMKKLPENIKLEIIGRGNPVELLKLSEKYNIQERIKFKGVITDRIELFKWLDDIDIYLQPSRTEGLPRATIEAMSRACPVISSKTAGGLKYLIDEQFLIEKEDYKGLRKLILKMINDKEIMFEQARINFEKVEEFTQENRDKKFYNFYSKI